MCSTFIWRVQIKCYDALIPRFGSCHLVLGNKLEKWTPMIPQVSQIFSLQQSLQSLQQSSLVSWLLEEVHREGQLEENLDVAPKLSQKYVSVKIMRQNGRRNVDTNMGTKVILSNSSCCHKDSLQCYVVTVSIRTKFHLKDNSLRSTYYILKLVTNILLLSSLWNHP